jgi:hypothetical protein
MQTAKILTSTHCKSIKLLSSNVLKSAKYTVELYEKNDLLKQLSQYYSAAIGFKCKI